MLKFPTNPFPGMNPWLESHWGDIHTSLTTYARDWIQKQLPGDLQARVEEYLSVVEPDEDVKSSRRIAPDVNISQQPGAGPSTAGTAAVQELVAEEPLKIRRQSPPQTLRYIRIVDLRDERKIVTAIEFLSPANKATAAGRRQYRQKQDELLEGEVNLVEIDLLRGGGWVLAASRETYPVRYQDPYRICVVRAADFGDAEIYRASFASTLPTIRIPLRSTDDDVKLPLQVLVNQAYENGRYGSGIDYAIAPDPPLEPVEQSWIDELFKHRSESAT